MRENGGWKWLWEVTARSPLRKAAPGLTLELYTGQADQLASLQPPGPRRTAVKTEGGNLFSP